MPQETNLNVYPYFDDFDVNKDYYQVLFKPGYPVQARELTTLQSILQNQVEQFGTHFFKEGSKVIPGQLSYNSNFYAVEIEDEFLGLPISLYLDQLVGNTIRGENSNVTAKVVKVLTAAESSRNTNTLYVDYLQSGTDAKSRQFNDAENLITENSIEFGTTSIQSGEGFAKTIEFNSTSTGSAFQVNEGVYFLRGRFVTVPDQTLILDQYTNTPSYRIGLFISEQVISSEIDSTLNDNAQGFTNFSAPGADRLKISAILGKKSIDDYDDRSFIELATVKNGILRDINDKIEYNILEKELARRTFDESGDYYVKAFDVNCSESLNNSQGNNGIYRSNQKTDGGLTPSEDLMVYKVSPGKAYVKGFEVETYGPIFLDAPKARNTVELQNQAVNFNFGKTLVLNRSHGSPSIGINTSYVVSLRDSRVGVDSTSAAGTEIGVARVYDFALEGGSYDPAVLDFNRWDLSLYDVQTYGQLTVNENTTIAVPAYIEGANSGATGFLRNTATNTKSITLYQTKGDFINGERLIVNGISNPIVATAYTARGLSDVKSVHGIVGSAKTFTADVLQIPQTSIGDATITAIDAATGVSTFTSPTVAFPGIVTTGNIVQYTRSGFTVPSFAKIESVQTNTFTASGVSTVSLVCDGGLPTTEIDVNNLTVLTSRQQTSSFREDSIYSLMPKTNVKSVDLSKSSLIVKKEYDVTITDNTSNTLTAGSNLVFLPFDEERYVLSRSDGSIEVLTEDKFTFTSGSQNLTISGLGANDSGAKLIATLRKSSITTKSKILNKVNVLTINKSNNDASGINVGTAATSLGDGLTRGNYPYGTRVQDQRICLNHPDIIDVFAIYESNDSSDPTLPSMSISNMDGPAGNTTDLEVGEEFIGSISGAKGLVVSKDSNTSITFVYLNDDRFKNEEVVAFQTSGINGISFNLDNGDTDLTNNYSFNTGQESNYYGYSSIIRRKNTKIPSRRIKVVFARASYDSSDNSDVTTANSYAGFDFSTQIKKINQIRNTDLIDARPRVKPFVVTEGARSPFEFYGRDFTGTVASSEHVLASDESISVDFDYYVGRIDKILLSKDGVFQVKFGDPADTPRSPQGINNAITIATVFNPPYTYDVRNVVIRTVNHKRYQMNDIFRLENRIKNLEYYTTLSLLESNTSQLFVPDQNGLNRFKSGFFVDNFSKVETQNVRIGVRNSVDTKRGELRPSHYTTAINLQVGSDAIAGIGSTTQSNIDQRTLTNVLGSNIKKTEDIVTLDYSDESWLRQPFATRSENVTPFLVKTWEGSIKFEPTVDVWIDVNRMALRDVEMEGSFLGVAEALQAEVTDQADGSRMGISAIDWKSWETFNVNVDFSQSQSSSSSTNFRQGTQGDWEAAGRTGAVASGFRVGEETTTTTTTQTVSVGLDQQRTGTQYTVREEINTGSLGDRIVNRNIIHFMRSRNIEFTSRRLKPFTQMYSFFEGVDVTRFCVPKLVEIEMINGTFQVGETIRGFEIANGTGEAPDTFESLIPGITFRAATSNHKYGPYNASPAQDIFERNPYDRENQIPAQYSSTSTVLNIDTFSLANELQSEFAGFITSGMRLVGQTSGAQATVTDVRLVSDRLGTLIGSFFVPQGGVGSNPSFQTGRSRFRLTSSDINSKVPGVVTTFAEETFYSQGDLDNTQEVTLSLRNARVDTQEFRETRTLSDSDSAVVGTETNTRLTGEYRDPLAQSFMVDDDTGIFITRLDVYFRTKDDSLPITCQIREVKFGTPTNKILPFSEIELTPDQVNTSDDASQSTSFIFDSPVYLEGNTEYAIVLISDSNDYNVWISRLGEPDVATLATEQGQILVSTQRTLGSLFKSQNASTWTASQYEDLTFQLFRASFVSEGSVQFFNAPELPRSLRKLRGEPLDINSRQVRAGIGTTVSDAGLTIGNKIIQSGTNATGHLVGLAGSIANDLSITNPGIGYTPISGSATYVGVALTNITGNGRNGTVDIHINNGVAVAATISNGGGGTGYEVGDLLSVSSLGSNNLGRNLRLSVSELGGFNELIIDKVQNDFLVGVAYTLSYVNNSGITTTINSTTGANVSITQPIVVETRGDQIKVNMRNHGFHTPVNLVTLSGVTPDVKPTSLSIQYDQSATGSISVASTANFTTFEGIGIAVTNPGYVQIDKEVISYTGVGINELTGISRSVDGTKNFTYPSGTPVFKYELNGVSLRRINKQHNLSNSTGTRPIDLDYYTINVDMSENGIDRTASGVPSLYFADNKQCGGKSVNSTYNLPFELITPNITSITPAGTEISYAVRTISGKSIDGTETPNEDRGFQGVSPSKINYFNSPRVILSQENENDKLEALPGNKSFTLNAKLTTTDNRIAPAIDLNVVSVITTTNRVNQPITNYVTDNRTAGIDEDPNEFIYVSRYLYLENPSTSLKIFLNALINEDSDIRAFYSISNEALIDIESTFIPFPGYSNINANGVMIDPSQSDGSSDYKIVKNDYYQSETDTTSFKDYVFTADNLPAFKTFAIKLVMSSKNQAYPPIVKDLRTIAFA
tara:strand:- start:4372 stop:11916 length:7545 start_codon:yes stop_codon:yes gene_type:complete